MFSFYSYRNLEELRLELNGCLDPIERERIESSIADIEDYFDDIAREAGLLDELHC